MQFTTHRNKPTSDSAPARKELKKITAAMKSKNTSVPPGAKKKVAEAKKHLAKSKAHEKKAHAKLKAANKATKPKPRRRRA